jgi:RimJ/RimL family protein N-acetyltransferase
VRSAEPLTAVRLDSERLVLEPLRTEHAAELAPVLDDVALHRFIGGEPLGPEELRARFERQARGRSPDGRDWWLNWALRERSTGRPIGIVQATVRRPDPEPESQSEPELATATATVSVAELAWVIGTAAQGRGFAKEAVAAVASWLRGCGASRLRAHIHPDHEASMAVARSVGLAPTDVVVDGEVRWESPP